MQRLTAVEEAKTLMNEAKDWSVWHWLLEKRRVRSTADKATDALGALEKKVKAAWSEDLKKAYRDLSGNGKAGKIQSDLKLALERIRQADDAAYDAEWMPRQPSTRLSGGSAPTWHAPGRRRRSKLGNCGRRLFGGRRLWGETTREDNCIRSC